MWLVEQKLLSLKLLSLSSGMPLTICPKTPDTDLLFPPLASRCEPTKRAQQQILLLIWPWTCKSQDGNDSGFGPMSEYTTTNAKLNPSAAALLPVSCGCCPNWRLGIGKLVVVFASWKKNMYIFLLIDWEKNDCFVCPKDFSIFSS